MLPVATPHTHTHMDAHLCPTMARPRAQCKTTYVYDDNALLP